MKLTIMSTSTSSFCPIPHTSRDQVWLAVGVGAGALVGFIAARVLSKDSSSPSTSAASAPSPSAAAAAASAASATPAFELRYWEVMAKGLGPALVAEWSGQKWAGSASLNHTKDDFLAMRESGEAPFGQLPLLHVPANAKGGKRVIAQTVAIMNHIGALAGTDGGDDLTGREWTTSQMLIAEAEDIYSEMQKRVDTMYVQACTSMDLVQVT